MGWTSPLHGVRVGAASPGVGPEGWLRCFAHPFGDVACREMCAVPCFWSQYPAVAPGSSKVEVGFFLVFVYLLSIIFPSYACTQLFLVPCSFFVFCGLRRLLSRCEPYSKGSQVPAVSQAGIRPEGHSEDLSLMSSWMAQKLFTLKSCFTRSAAGGRPSWLFVRNWAGHDHK